MRSHLIQATAQTQCESTKMWNWCNWNMSFWTYLYSYIIFWRTMYWTIQSKTNNKNSPINYEPDLIWGAAVTPPTFNLLKPEIVWISLPSSGLGEISHIFLTKIRISPRSNNFLPLTCKLSALSQSLSTLAHQENRPVASDSPWNAEKARPFLCQWGFLTVLVPEQTLQQSWEGIWSGTAPCPEHYACFQLWLEVPVSGTQPQTTYEKTLNLTQNLICYEYLRTAENSLLSFILRLSLSNTAERVSISISVNPSAVRASGVFLSRHSRQRAASWGSSNNRAWDHYLKSVINFKKLTWVRSMNALSGLRFLFRKSTQCFSNAGTAYFLAVYSVVITVSGPIWTLNGIKDMMWCTWDIRLSSYFITVEKL